jgi:hypothetical protein
VQTSRHFEAIMKQGAGIIFTARSPGLLVPWSDGQMINTGKIMLHCATEITANSDFTFRPVRLGCKRRFYKMYVIWKT